MSSSSYTETTTLPPISAESDASSSSASSSSSTLSSSSSSSSSSPSSTPSSPPNPLVQYVVLRKDLKWPTGALVAQGAHACVAAVWLSRDTPDTIAYCTDMDNMHKVTLEAQSASTLDTVSSSLTAAGILHKVWIEEPEKVPTCLATAPARRAILKPFFTALKLLR